MSSRVHLQEVILVQTNFALADFYQIGSAVHNEKRHNGSNVKAILKYGFTLRPNEPAENGIHTVFSYLNNQRKISSKGKGWHLSNSSSSGIIALFGGHPNCKKLCQLTKKHEFV